MSVSRRNFLQSVKTRKAKRFNIDLASSYLKSVADVVGAGIGSERYLGVGGLFAFRQALKDSAQQPVYGNARTLPQKGLSDKSKQILKKLKAEGQDFKACMKFEGILTTTRRDRDGDVLESKGAQIDPVMPLLWQHNACEPIGRHLGVVHRSDHEIRNLMAIADTPLGRDAAKLVEFGALRISHGFNPIEFEPLDDEETRGFPGWHVKKFEVCEVSLVSIPSNVDAVITAWQNKKLHTPLMTGWARSLYEKRTKIVRSGYGKSRNGVQTTGQGSVTVNLNIAERSGGADPFERLEALIAKSVAGAKRKGGRGGMIEDLEEETREVDGAPVGLNAGDGEEDDEEPEEDDEEYDEEETLLQKIRSELQDLMDSGELPDERQRQIYEMILTVSEAIGAECAEKEALGESDKDDNFDMFDRDSETDMGNMDADHEDEDKMDDALDQTENEEDSEEEDDDSYMQDEEHDEEDDDVPMRGKEDEDEEEKRGPGCRNEDESDEEKGDPPGWDGEDVEDENTGTHGPPKTGRTAPLADAAEYLLMELKTGGRLSPATRRRLQDALEE